MAAVAKASRRGSAERPEGGLAGLDVDLRKAVFRRSK